MIFGLTNPIGIYFLFSDECLGTIIYSVVEALLSSKRVGMSAFFLVASFLLFSLNSLTASTLFLTSGNALSSDGEAPTSQRHQRFFLFKNSCAPTNGRINLLALGSFVMKSSYSSASIIKLPSSVGWLPFVISGISQRALFLLSTKTSGASIRYPLMFFASIACPLSNNIFGLLVGASENPIITQCTCAFRLASLSHLKVR